MLVLEGADSLKVLLVELLVVGVGVVAGMGKTSAVHSALPFSVGRVPGSAYSRGAISLFLTTTPYHKYLQVSTNMVRYLL